MKFSGGCKINQVVVENFEHGRNYKNWYFPNNEKQTHKLNRTYPVQFQHASAKTKLSTSIHLILFHHCLLNAELYTYHKCSGPNAIN